MCVYMFKVFPVLVILMNVNPQKKKIRDIYFCFKLITK